MSTILSISGLSKSYGSVQAVKNLSIEVKAGNIFGILGPNGSGKTTTLGIVLDVLKADGGTYQWFGEESSPESRKRIGSILETPNFFPYLSGLDNLKIVADTRGVSYDGIEQVLQLTGLFERKDSKFKTYSLGMKQRLSMASALLDQPEVLVLDEPTNGLDPQGIAEVRGLIQQMAAAGSTIILASHILDEVEKVCTHVAILRKGELLYTGRVEDVLAGTDMIEVSSNDQVRLEAALNSWEKTKKIKNDKGIFLVMVNGTADGAELNKMLFEKGIVVSHLSVRKKSLETQFLEMIKQ